MTDSESETELPDHVGVACAAEAAAIIAIGCVAGLKGLAKMRKEVTSPQSHMILDCYHVTVIPRNHPR